MTVCLVCGDIGLDVALDLCQKCQQYGCHRYCQKELPKVLHEACIWLCGDCEPKDANSATQLHNISDISTSFGDWSSRNELESIEKGDDNNEDSDEDDDINFSDQKLRKRRRLSLEEEKEEEASTLIFDDSLEQVKYPNVVKEATILGFQPSTDEIICEEIRSCVEQVCGKARNSDAKLKQWMEDDMSRSEMETSGVLFLNVKPSEILAQELVSEKMVQMQDDTNAVSDSQYMEDCVDGPTFSSENYGVPSKDATVSDICDQKLLKNQRAEPEVLQDMPLVPEGSDSKSAEKSDSSTKVARRRGTEEKKKFDQDRKLDGRQGFVSKNLDVETTTTPQVSPTVQASTNLSEQRVISGSVAKQVLKISDNGRTPFKAKKIKEEQRSELSKVPVSKVDPSHVSQEKETSGYEGRNMKTREKRLILDKDEVQRSGISQLEPLHTVKEKIITCSKATMAPRRRGRCDKDMGGERKASKARGIHHKRWNHLDKRFSNGHREKKPRHTESRYRRGSDLEGESGVLYRGIRDESPRLTCEDGEPPILSRRAFFASVHRCRYEYETARPSDSRGQTVTSGFRNEVYQHHIPSDFNDAVPMVAPIWSGILKIRERGSNFHKRFIVADAHLSSLANNQAAYVAQILPNCILSSTYTLSELWPRSSDTTWLSSHHIGLYFFPRNSRHAHLFEELIDDMYRSDYALSALFENEELVVFTSHVLPLHCRTIDSKFYLWGGFRTRGFSMVTDRLRPQPYAFIR